jgi:hypothetical protein
VLILYTVISCMNITIISIHRLLSNFRTLDKKLSISTLYVKCVFLSVFIAFLRSSLGPENYFPLFLSRVYPICKWRVRTKMAHKDSCSWRDTNLRIARSVSLKLYGRNITRYFVRLHIFITWIWEVQHSPYMKVPGRLVTGGVSLYVFRGIFGYWDIWLSAKRLSSLRFVVVPPQPF